jgi:hypothetical protein
MSPKRLRKGSIDVESNRDEVIIPTRAELFLQYNQAIGIAPTDIDLPKVCFAVIVFRGVAKLTSCLINYSNILLVMESLSGLLKPVRKLLVEVDL